jgi:cytochrome c-type biogenesis protein CcmH
MTLWFVFALMTVAASFAVLWPLGRHGQPQRGGSEAAVYRDQLAEIDRDVASGLIGSSEAEAARVEISRRLLAAVDAQCDPPAAWSNLKWRRLVAVALVGLPVLTIAIYLPLGSPQLGDFQLAQRARTPGAAQPLDSLVAQVQAHLEKDPTDGRGWSVLAPVLARLGRYDEAVAPIIIRSRMTATVPSAGPISAKPLPAPPVASSPRTPRPNSNAPSR